jgi:hypothetical protein
MEEQSILEAFWNYQPKNFRKLQPRMPTGGHLSNGTISVFPQALEDTSVIPHIFWKFTQVSHPSQVSESRIDHSIIPSGIIPSIIHPSPYHPSIPSIIHPSIHPQYHQICPSTCHSLLLCFPEQLRGHLPVPHSLRRADGSQVGRFRQGRPLALHVLIPRDHHGQAYKVFGKHKLLLYVCKLWLSPTQCLWSTTHVVVGMPFLLLPDQMHQIQILWALFTPIKILIVLAHQSPV